MSSDLIKLQKKLILDAVKYTDPAGQWRYVVADTEALALIDGVVTRDEIISQNVAGVEELESRRSGHHDMEAVYFLTPKPHILECLLSEFKRQRPRHLGGHLVWTSRPAEAIKSRLDRQTVNSSRWVLSERILPINFYPMESHVFTFRDPKSFYPLYNPKCDALAQREFSEIAKKILGVCVALDEYPVIRYFHSPHLSHRASKLPEMIAHEVQRELDFYHQYMEASGKQWPSQDSALRPRGLLFIVDRSMDPTAPLLHEFTYQAMAHDLLPIQDEDGKITYTPQTADPRPMLLNEEDTVWTKVRHKHMTEAISTVMADLDKFIKDHPEFQSAENANTVFALKTMLAALPQFSATKDAYELHLTMAQDCMNIFRERALPDIADLEQNLATGLDSGNEKARDLTDQLVGLLDSPTTKDGNDRLRLIMLYLIWRDGLLGPDIEKLFRHGNVVGPVRAALYNLDLIGVRVLRRLKEGNRPGYKNPLVGLPPVPEGMELSRYVPAVKTMLEDQIKGTLDLQSFPFTDPAAQAEAAQLAGPQTSLRSSKPTWTRRGGGSGEVKQRIIVFVAGGATYSEARSCYEVSQAYQRDVYLGSSHMVSPNSWLGQLAFGRDDRLTLMLEGDQPPLKPPAHLFEPDPEPKRPPPQPQGAGRGSSSGNIPKAGHPPGGRHAAPPSGKHGRHK